jgi:hypothetical protein
MVIALDVSRDFEEVCNDFQESCTLRIGDVDTMLSNVLTDPHETKELEPAGGQVLRIGTNFVWSKSRSVKPPIGSIIIDEGGVYWTIWRLTDKQHVETYEAFGLNLNIVTADANEATVLKAVYGKGSANEATATWHGLWSGVAGGNATDTVVARFQPSEETSELEFGAEYSREVYRVYFEQPVPVEVAGGEYRLVDSTGNRFRVVKYFQENRIDKLPIAICVKITEGAEYYSGQ